MSAFDLVNVLTILISGLTIGISLTTIYLLRRHRD